MVWFEVRGSDDSPWQVLKPLAWFEPADDEAAMLPPGEQTDETVPIYFGDSGWTFTEAGEYQVRARLQTGDDDPEIISAETTLKVAAPDTDDERAVLQPLLDDEQRLDPGVGRLLTLGGRIGAEDAIEPLQAAVEKFGHTALGSALRLTLISQRLRPAIDPRTGTRPTPDLSGARELLEDTCTDSGIAALKHELLQRHANSMPAAMSDDINTSAAAWDGVMATPGETVATYSDPSLRAWGPSLHFCFNEASLRGPTRAAVTRIARQLRSKQPRRLVIVGHGDAEGTCRYNDKLALRRADAVRRALISAGARKVVIQTASLGERRPLDFSSTATAHNLNRRVDILVETDADPTPAAAEHVLPRCPARAMTSSSSRSL
jgi:outer membrane protein OmpA-like peptidoglycan-associated protein